jgi:hypothetical protein
LCGESLGQALREYAGNPGKDVILVKKKKKKKPEG